MHGREGSHVTLKKEGEMNLLTVPFHKQLKQGTFLAVL
ncbi:type II toxin-antitoxin system HicA family toxin [Candidatus Woesearchaeota archaeon]|nr:type II toxin-antitoxin system HicA family toxin [Candidatus Woesearchaeota archaeon]